MRTKVKTISILWIKISPKFGLQGSKLASKWSKMAKINIFSKLKELGCWFLIISSIFHPEEFSYNKFRLPKLLVTQISPSGVAERSPKWPKKGKINIISKLKGLGYWFFILSPHFPPGEVRLQQFQIPPNYWLPKILPLWFPKGPQNGPKRVKLTYFRNYKS